MESDPSPLNPTAHPADIIDADLGLEALRLRPLDFILPLVCGGLLWFFVSWDALSLEFAMGQARIPIVLIHLQPLVVLGACILARKHTLLVALYPMALVAPFFVLDPHDLAPLNEWQGAGVITSLLLLFVFATASVAGRTKARRRVPSKPGRRTTPAAGFAPLMRWFYPRLLLLLALLLLPAIALYGESGQQRLHQAFGTQHQEALAVIHLAHVFIAALAAFWFFLLPAIHLDADTYYRRLHLRSMRSRANLPRYRRNLILLFCAGIVVVGAFYGYLHWA